MKTFDEFDLATKNKFKGKYIDHIKGVNMIQKIGKLMVSLLVVGFQIPFQRKIFANDELMRRYKMMQLWLNMKTTPKTRIKSKRLRKSKKRQQ